MKSVESCLSEMTYFVFLLKAIVYSFLVCFYHFDALLTVPLTFKMYTLFSEGNRYTLFKT